MTMPVRPTRTVPSGILAKEPVSQVADADYGPETCLACGVTPVPTEYMKCLNCAHEAVIEWRKGNPFKGRKG